MSRRLELLITVAGDALFLSAVYFISWKVSAINQSVMSWHAITGNLIFVAYWLFLFRSFNLYKTRARIQLVNESFNLFKVLFLGMLVFVGLAYLVQINFITARGFIPSCAVMLASVIVWRFAWRGIVGEYLKPRPEKVIIFKNGDNIKYNQHFNVVETVTFENFNPALNSHVLDRSDVDGIVIESNGHRQAEVLNIISKLADTRYEIFVSPKLYSLVYEYFLVQKVADSPFLKVVFHPLSHWEQIQKRVMDMIIAVTALFVLSPLLALIALFIKVDNPGPIFYRQKRVGLRGKEFMLYKFRSMIHNAEKHTGPVWARKNDSRVTRIGKIMRPYRLDEIPQIINVLMGDMSFVGPRPERPAFIARLKRSIPFYSLRLNVHPGITGLAQVKHSYDASLDDVKKKLSYDLEYINNMSIPLDLKIFLKTVLTVVKKEGAL
jgi:exopolysaccharide biosynthesis polyprenyl glycosylphosphotransferase